jgi:hypothetical protein
VVVDALVRGEQILDLRKGGIHEEGHRFDLRQPRFWLFPTYEHQDAGLVKPAHRSALERVRAERSAGVERIEGWAEVVGTALLTDPEPLAALDEHFIWTASYAAKRLRWKQRQPLWLLALRVWRLEEPVVVPLLPEYGGCTSWVALRGVPDEPTLLSAVPAVAAAQFERRLRAVEAAVPGGLVPVRGLLSGAVGR